MAPAGEREAERPSLTVAPYRTVSRAERAAAPRDPGIVGEIIAQFADPLAFYRELVQNAIDAGSPSVDIELAYDEAAGVLRVAVRDRGEGMTRDTIEHQLLVLFRSTKDRDDSKIGKFGIGFTSVLAPSPQVVAVHTARDGRRLTLHLHRDLTYQLFDAGPATQTGTSVELDLAMRAGEVEAFAGASRAALERWCRHASVPIHLTARWPGQHEPLAARIDRPLGLDDALVVVTGRSGDGKLTAVVGLTSPATSYCGFFNHGLTLYETTEPLLGRVAVKLQDARLGHTLSRDDVRRDEHFERALGFARSLVERALPAEVATALRTAATAEPERWWRIATALDEAKLELPRRAWCVPLIEPIGERRAIDARDLPDRVWAAAASSRLTQLAAASGRVIVHGPAPLRAMLRDLLADVAGTTVADVAALTAVTPVEVPDEVAGMLALLRDHLDAVYRAPSAIVVARLDGAQADALALAGDRDAPPGRAYVVEDDHAARNPLARRRLPLVLSERHELYRGACALDPRAGAALLARLILFHHRVLDAGRSAMLLERTLDQLGVGT